MSFGGCSFFAMTGGDEVAMLFPSMGAKFTMLGTSATLLAALAYSALLELEPCLGANAEEDPGMAT